MGVVERDRLEWRPLRAIPGRPEQSDPVKQSGSWVLPGLWPEGVLLLAGRPKSGKTTLAIGAMVEIACGGEWCGELVRKRRVAVITEVPGQTLSGIQAYAQHMGREGDEAIEVYGPEQAWLPLNRHTDWWRGLLERVGPGGVVFLDTLMRVVRVADWNDAAQVQDALEPLLEEARQRGVSVWIIHHISKAPTWQNAPVGEASVLGSTYLAGAVDVLALLQKKGRDGILVRVQGRGVPETDFRFRRVSLSPTQFLWEPRDGPEARKAPAVAAPGQNGQKALTAREDAPSLTALERRILEDLTANGPSTIREIAARIGKRANQVRTVLYAMKARGLAREVGEQPRPTHSGGRREKVWAAPNAPMPQCHANATPMPLYIQAWHSHEGIDLSADSLESANGDSISNAGITLKDVEIRRNLKDITSRYNEFIQQRRNRADMSSISSESRVESSNFNPESIKSARISMNFDHHRANHEESSNESPRDLSSISNDSAVDPDELIDYLLEFPYGMHEILPRFFPFLHRGDGLLEQGRQLAKTRPEVCLRVNRARALMGRMVQEWNDNRLELFELAADLGLIRREEAERDWHPEILKALLAASFLHDPARMTRAEQFLEEPLGPRVPHNAPRGHSQDVHPEGVDLSPVGASPAGRSISEAPVVRIVYVQGETGICARFLAAQCPYCGGIHEHGGGSGSEPVEEFLGVTRAHCVSSGPEYRLVIRGDPEMAHEPLRKATEEAPSAPDPAAEALIEPLLQALDAGIRTDVALAERLKAPRYRVQEALRILAARGQVAAFASDGVCCWARVPPGSPTEARESSHSDSESSSIPAESDASNDGYREVFVWADISTRYRDVFWAVLEKRAPRPSEVRPARVPTSDRLLDQYFTLISRRTARISSISSDSSDEYPED